MNRTTIEAALNDRRLLAPMPGDNKIVLFLANASKDDPAFTWLIKGDPLPATTFTTAQLKQQGMVGVFRPTSEAEQADPKNAGLLYQWVTNMPHPDEYTPKPRYYTQPDGTVKTRTLTDEEYREFASGFVLLPAILANLAKPLTNPLMVGFYRPNPSKCVGYEEVKPNIIGEPHASS